MAAPTPSSMRKMREDLISSPSSTYIGAFKPSDKLPDISWVKTDAGNIAVPSAEAEVYEAALAAHNENPSKSPAPEMPNAMVFSVVARVSTHKFFFMPTGGYDGQKGFNTSFLNQKLNALLQAPRAPAFDPDWDNVLRNIEVVTKSASREGAVSRGVLVNEPQEPMRLRLRHILFESADNAEDEDMPDIFLTKNWPDGGKPACRAELDDIIKAGKHIVRPLPAFDQSGEILQPNNYQSALKGSLSVVYFTLMHYNMFETDSRTKTKVPVDGYSADVANIAVIIPPPAAPSSPRTGIKRFSMTNPLSPKKRRTT